MGYWTANTKAISEALPAFKAALSNKQICYIDGGAAGKISEPFNVIEDLLLPVRFEPRGDNEINFSGKDIHISGGLWSSDITLPLHVGQIGTTSSICKPNSSYLANFDDHDVFARKTVNVISVPLRSVDSCVSNGEIPLPNFIKLDVHSSELPALLGSVNSLSECVGLLVETWNSEIHLGQGLHYEVERFALEHGFDVYDSYCAARWLHKYEGQIDINDRGQYIGTEILFIKRTVPPHLLIIKALVLLIFGFASKAKSTLTEINNRELVDSLIKAIELYQLKRSKSLKLKIKKKLQHAVAFASKFLRYIY